MAQTFKTSDGQEWHVTLTVGNVDRVKEIAAIDLYETQDFEKVIEKPRHAILVVAAILQPELAARGMTNEQMLNVMDADACFGAIDALREAIANFGPAEIRKQRLAILGKIRKAEMELSEHTLTTIENQIAKEVEKAKKKEEEAIAEMA